MWRQQKVQSSVARHSFSDVGAFWWSWRHFNGAGTMVLLCFQFPSAFYLTFPSTMNSLSHLRSLKTFWDTENFFSPRISYVFVSQLKNILRHMLFFAYHLLYIHAWYLVNLQYGMLLKKWCEPGSGVMKEFRRLMKSCIVYWVRPRRYNIKSQEYFLSGDNYSS